MLEKLARRKTHRAWQAQPLEKIAWALAQSGLVGGRVEAWSKFASCAWA